MMYRIYNSKSSSQAKNYYIKPASLEAYYSEGQEFTGFWGGKAAQKLGLDGRVGNEAFSRLCDNLHPETGEKLTVRMNENRTVGYDHNFNCPKSVSLVYAWTKDERIIKAFRQAVRDTMEEIELAAAARQRAGLEKGADKNRTTGNLVWAEFIHLTARPERGFPDPHLHAHCFVPNVTFDPVEKKWKALQMYDIHREANYYNGAVTMRLAENLKAIGLPIETSEKSFEIAGISREIIEGFSKRRHRILAEAERRGYTDPAKIDQLAAQTRENKAKTLLMSELEKVWFTDLPAADVKAFTDLETLLKHSRVEEMTQKLASHAGEMRPAEMKRETTADFLGQKQEIKPSARRISLNRLTVPEPPVVGHREPTTHDRRAVALAMEHLFERRSVVTEKQLMAEAFRNWCVGKATTAGIRQAVAEAPLIRAERGNSTLVTTWEVLSEENRIIDKCKQGKCRYEALNASWRIQDQRLNEEQRDAVKHVLTSRDWITGVSGKAGTGKTTLLQEARRGIEAGGNKLLVLAPTAAAAREVLRKEGFENAETVAKLIENPWLQRKAQGSVVWVDEAGLLSTRQTDRLFRVAERVGARLVLAGDTGQLHAVERGQAFDLLQRHGELPVADVTEVLRQEGEYRNFAMHLGAGRVDEAVESLHRMDALREMTVEERESLLAAKYLSTRDSGETVAVVCPTHRECDNVTAAIREALKERGELGKSEERNVLRDLHWTTAQKRDSEHYQSGLVVAMNARVPGFEPGEYMTVMETGEDGILVRAGGKKRMLPLDKPNAFTVYERKQIELAVGDEIRITANGYKRGEEHLVNSTQHVIKKINRDGSLKLNDGTVVGKDFAHLAHGYVSTIHAAQGKTVDRVFVAQSPEFSEISGDVKQFYTATTRGRKGLEVITTDIEQLVAGIHCERERLMATDMLAEDEPRIERKVVEQRERNVAENPDIKLSEQLEKIFEKPEPTEKKLSGQTEQLEQELSEESVPSEERHDKQSEHPQKTLSETLGKAENPQLAPAAGAELARITQRSPAKKHALCEEMVMVAGM